MIIDKNDHLKRPLFKRVKEKKTENKNNKRTQISYKEKPLKH